LITFGSSSLLARRLKLR